MGWTDYHVLMPPVRAAAPRNPPVATKADGVIRRYERKLTEQAYVGEDVVANWTWYVEGSAQ